MDELKGLADKASKKSMKEPEQDMASKAKMAVLQHIHKMASDAMGDDYMGDHGGDDDLSQNKAVVSADSREGLEKGLNKAADLVSKHGEPLGTNAMDDEGDEGDESMEDSMEDASPADASAPKASSMIGDQIKHEGDEGELSDDELDGLIAELQSRKMKK